ncbi:hypothetical protein RSAG8_07040, partial [Rhizoctonia solani AG-8 WAC10335]
MCCHDLARVNPFPAEHAHRPILDLYAKSSRPEPGLRFLGLVWHQRLGTSYGGPRTS